MHTCGNHNCAESIFNNTLWHIQQQYPGSWCYVEPTGALLVQVPMPKICFMSAVRPALFSCKCWLGFIILHHLTIYRMNIEWTSQQIPEVRSMESISFAAGGQRFVSTFAICSTWWMGPTFVLDFARTHQWELNRALQGVVAWARRMHRRWNKVDSAGWCLVCGTEPTPGCKLQKVAVAAGN